MEGGASSGGSYSSYSSSAPCASWERAAAAKAIPDTSLLCSCSTIACQTRRGVRIRTRTYRHRVHGVHTKEKEKAQENSNSTRQKHNTEM